MNIYKVPWDEQEPAADMSVEAGSSVRARAKALEQDRVPRGRVRGRRGR